MKICTIEGSKERMMMGTTGSGRQLIPCPVPDSTSGIRLAGEQFHNGRHRQAFDLLNQLLDDFPQAGEDILAVAYDLYQQLPDKSRYHLYQSRYFDFSIKPEDRILDVGSGHSPFPLATHLADIAINEASLGRGGNPFRHVAGKPVYECNMENMPFSRKAFDFIYCSHALEHVENPEKACLELMRIGKRGYIESPTRGKDIFLNSTKVSNHKWFLESINGVLVFTECTEEEIDGLRSNILLDMHCKPETKREKAFSALIYLRAHLVNTMMMWEDTFEFEVRRTDTCHVTPKPSTASNRLYQNRFLKESRQN